MAKVFATLMCTIAPQTIVHELQSVALSPYSRDPMYTFPNVLLVGFFGRVRAFPKVAYMLRFVSKTLKHPFAMRIKPLPKVKLRSLTAAYVEFP